MTPATNPNTGGDYDKAGIAPEAEDMAANMAPDSDETAMFRGLYEMHSPDGPEHWPVLFGKFTESCNASRTSPSTTSAGSRRPLC